VATGKKRAARPARTALAPIHNLRVLPLTPSRWSDLEALFGPRGACGGCWCMVWRLPRAAWTKGKGAGNRRALRRIVTSGAAPGLIAYAGGEPVGWCAVAPRADYSGLARSRVLAPLDDTPVWSVTCLFVARAHRRRGVTVALLKASTEFARTNGASVVEGYPVEPWTDEVPAAFAWTGLPSAFLKAGFVEVARRSRTRPIMRWTSSARPSSKRTQPQPKRAQPR